MSLIVPCLLDAPAERFIYPQVHTLLVIRQMSEVVFVTDAREFLGEQFVSSLESLLNIRVRGKNSLVLSVNSKENKLRWRLKLSRNSENFSDSIRDLHFLTGLVDTMAMDLTMSLDYLLREIKENDYQFHHLTGDTLNIDSPVLLVSEWQHRRLDFQLWKARA